MRKRQALFDFIIYSSSARVDFFHNSSGELSALAATLVFNCIFTGLFGLNDTFLRPLFRSAFFKSSYIACRSKLNLAAYASRFFRTSSTISSFHIVIPPCFEIDFWFHLPHYNIYDVCLKKPPHLRRVSCSLITVH